MEKYDEVLVQKPIRTTGTIAPGSHYNEKGYKYGRSRDWGDVSPEVQRQVIDALVAAGKKAGLTDHDIASVLAIVRYESGFNPDLQTSQAVRQVWGSSKMKPGNSMVFIRYST